MSRRKQFLILMLSFAVTLSMMSFSVFADNEAAGTADPAAQLEQTGEEADGEAVTEAADPATDPADLNEQDDDGEDITDAAEAGDDAAEENADEPLAEGTVPEAQTEPKEPLMATPSSGTCGTVTWSIDEDGNMVFKPTEGDEGTLARVPENNAPWKSHQDDIKTIKFEGTVHSNANSSYLFAFMHNLESIDFTNFDTTQNPPTTYEGIFGECSKLKDVDLSALNTSAAKNFSFFFYGCEALENVDVSNVVTSAATNLSAFFYGCNNLKSADLSSWDTSSVTDMSHMFSGCNSIETIDLTGLNADNVTTMNQMFLRCYDLTEIKGIEGISTPKNKSMYAMFYLCQSIKSLDLSSWDFSQVTTMYDTFYLMESLETLTLPSDPDMSKVTNMDSLFFGCTSLKELDLSVADKIKPSTAYSMFARNESLTKLDISTLDISDCKYFKDYFHDCNSLEEITIGEGFRFKQGTPENQLSTGFPRGMWKYSGDGKIYPATEIVEILEQGSMPGTFTKVADHSIQAEFAVDYSIGEVTDVKFETDREDIFKTDENGGVYTYIDGDSLGSDTYEVPGSFTLTFPDCVEDANGNTYSLQMKYKDMVIHDAQSITENKVKYTKYYHRFFRLSSDGVPVIQGEDRSNLNIDVDPAVSTTSEYDITLTIIDKNGNPVDGGFIFSIYDLDIPSPLDYGQPGTKSGVNTGYTDKSYGYYSEGVYLGKGFDKDTLTKADNSYTWEVGDTDKGYRITGTQVDGSSELTDIIIKANASGSSFVWTGWSCEDFILYRYQPKPVHFDKVDQNGDRVDGAKLALYKITTDADGDEHESSKPVRTWTTDSSKEHDLSIFLQPGKYRLKETKVPDGYEKADPVTFIIDTDFDVCDEDGNKLENGNIVSMTDIKKDEPEPGECEILISKVDDEGASIAGAVFEIFMVEDGDEEQLTHDDYDWLDSNDQFTVGKEPFSITDLGDGTYVIKEVKAPSGYVIDSKEPVEFTISDGELDASENSIASNVEYEELDDESHLFTITNEKEEGGGGHKKGVDTGDHTNIALYAGIFAAAAALLIAALIIRRRRNEQ